MNFDLWAYLGINVNDPNIPHVVLFSLSILCLITVSVFCFINLMFYFIILRISDTCKTLLKIKGF